MQKARGNNGLSVAVFWGDRLFWGGNFCGREIVLVYGEVSPALSPRKVGGHIFGRRASGYPVHGGHTHAALDRGTVSQIMGTELNGGALPSGASLLLWSDTDEEILGRSIYKQRKMQYNSTKLVSGTKISYNVNFDRERATHLL